MSAEEDAWSVVNPACALTISQVAERTGLSVATLRVWEGRYGLSPSRTTAGGHRRYSSADLDRLRTAQQLIAGGSSTGEAVRAAMSTARDGNCLPTLILEPDVSAAGRHLADACFQLDGPTCSALLREHVARDGVETAWETLLRPVLRAIGRQWSLLAHGIAVEHMLAHISSVVLAETVRFRTAPQRPSVFLACAPGELHDLPLVALHSALAPATVDSTLFGARTPSETLLAAAQQQRPSAVVVFSLLPDWADVNALNGFDRQVTVLAAGPGWGADQLPRHVRHVNDLPHARQAIEELAGTAHR
jgi:DNA-binding transcriptional MerR regulator